MSDTNDADYPKDFLYVSLSKKPRRIILFI